MFWLCFYNGFDKPEIESAFSASYLLVDYVNHFIDSDRVKCYTVFCPDDTGAVSLEKFLEN